MLVKILLVTDDDSDAALIEQQLPLWYGGNVEVVRVSNTKQAFDALNKASREQDEFDRVLWNPSGGETTDLGLLKKSFPSVNFGIISSQNLSAGVRAYARTQDWETINLNQELGKLRDLVDHELRRKSGNTERIQLNRELASLDAQVLQLKERVGEIEKLIRSSSESWGHFQLSNAESVNRLVFQSGELVRRLELLEQTVRELEKDALGLEERIEDLEVEKRIARDAKDSDPKGTKTGIITAAALGIGTFLTMFLPLIAPSINTLLTKWFDPERIEKTKPASPTPSPSTPLSSSPSRKGSK